MAYAAITLTPMGGSWRLVLELHTDEDYVEPNQGLHWTQPRVASNLTKGCTMTNQEDSRRGQTSRVADIRTRRYQDSEDQEEYRVYF